MEWNSNTHGDHWNTTWVPGQEKLSQVMGWNGIIKILKNMGTIFGNPHILPHIKHGYANMDLLCYIQYNKTIRTPLGNK